MLQNTRWLSRASKLMVITTIIMNLTFLNDIWNADSSAKVTLKLLSLGSSGPWPKGSIFQFSTVYYLYCINNKNACIIRDYDNRFVQATWIRLSISQSQINVLVFGPWEKWIQPIRIHTFFTRSFTPNYNWEKNLKNKYIF